MTTHTPISRTELTNIQQIKSPKFAVFLFALFCTPLAFSANWFVDSNATGGSRNGSSWTNAWTSFATISWGLIGPGDVILVRGGPYPERVTIAKSGSSSSNRIILKGVGQPIVRGFNGGAYNYIAIIGFEITQSSTADTFSAISFSGGTGWLIEDNYIHDTYLSGVAGTCSYFIIRHNTFYDVGRIGGGNGGGSNPNNISVQGNYNLVEYNSVSKGMDRTRAFGIGNVIRNNYWGATDTALYSSSPQYPSHTDDFQSWDNLRQLMYERNWSTDNIDSVGGTNSHGMLIQELAAGSQIGYVINRFNVGVREGGGVAAFKGVDNVYVYNNTWVTIQVGSSSQYQVAQGFEPPLSSSSAADTADIRNNTLTNSPNCREPKGFYGTTSSAYLTNWTHGTNHTYNYGAADAKYASGASPANLPMADPLFVDRTNDDYRLQAGSPLRNAGSGVTSAVNAGSNSSTLSVADAKRLFDGWGIADADWIRIGAGALVQIQSVDLASDTVTITAPRTWNAGDAVFVKGNEDVGAQPYSFATTFNVTNTTPTLQAGANSLSATVDKPDAVRMVEFLVDGIPVGIDFTQPYSVNYNSDGNAHTVVARAYAAWAAKTLTVESVSSGTVVPPSNAQIQIGTP